MAKSSFKAKASVYSFMVPSSSKMSLSRMAFWNMAVRRTISWSGGGWSPADEMLDEMLVDALDGTIDEAMIEAWVDEMVEAMIGALDVASIMALDEALIMALDEMLDDAMVTSSRASFKLRMWLVGVLQVEHPCCMQGEFLRQVF